MAIFGVSCGFHDAAISVIDGDEILFAAHAERYSKIKNDKYLNNDIVREALSYGEVDTLVYYEKPILKKTRMWFSGQNDDFKYKTHLRKFFGKIPIETVGHHQSHAAAGYYTSGFDDAAIIVADAVGEWDTLSVWVASGDVMKKVASTKYPDSLGLLYSAFTRRCGFKPNEEEYILMGASAFGTPNLVEDIKREFVEPSDQQEFLLKKNVHRGIGNWMPKASMEDIAASIQCVLEDYLTELFEWVSYTTGKRKLVFMGGVALNCVANSKLATRRIFDDIWIMPNPGDAGSALGAALAYTNQHVNWKHPYLGTDINRDIDIDMAVDKLSRGHIIAVANGRAEYGPRALGNRSILADPRTRSSKHRVTTIKQRQQFRPFAASVLEAHAANNFMIPLYVGNSPYMQYTWRATAPRSVPAICHVDSTSRIQTVNDEQHAVLHALLTRWYDKTGCPILLNTSMNIRGMPLVNTWEDAEVFSDMYDVPIF
jgi:carbamoyltransferase